ncbi:hypothetical protein Tsubulata_003483, partial [Turnera subulata]
MRRKAYIRLGVRNNSGPRHPYRVLHKQWETLPYGGDKFVVTN